MAYINLQMDEESCEMRIETGGSLYNLILSVSEIIVKIVEDHAEDFDEASTILAETLHVLHSDTQETLMEDYQ